MSRWLLGAALGGVAIGTGSLAATPDGRAALAAKVKPAAVALGIMRARAPEPGDYWHGCNDARAAGTAPIYRDEPGYRETMDGDNDGIACEPQR
ncbi:MAG: excalibur calcium-binding domain-containing protein [Novosphingobium sp.]